MGNAGLLLVGAVLYLNGLVTLGVVPGRSAALLNIFVGAIEVAIPTILLITGGTDADFVNGVWPTYLFGITYLYFGIGILLDSDQIGLGWYSSFVAGIAGLQAILTVGDDPVFAVMWLTWAVMWSLFFLLLGLGVEGVARFTGWFLVLGGIPSCTVSALFLLHGRWDTSATAGWLALAALAVGSVAAFGLARSGVARASVAPSGALEVAPT
ncbi:MAG TPA: AmiS/UreI family transporter [Solirubrobacter sp.]|nr:AmiS/UreI family transporter [Solirubrobacter sp.]